MEDERRDSDGLGIQPGALRIYDGAISEEFCNELIEIYNLNTDKESSEYNYTEYHKDEEVHERLLSHIGQLYKHYLEDLGTTNMIKVSGFEEIKIKNLTETELHVDANDHKSSIRAVSFLFFLDDNSGNTDFPLQKMGVHSRKGRVIIHPTSWEYPKKQHKSEETEAFTLETFLHFS